MKYPIIFIDILRRQLFRSILITKIRFSVGFRFEIREFAMEVLDYGFPLRTQVFITYHSISWRDVIFFLRSSKFVFRDRQAVLE